MDESTLFRLVDAYRAGKSSKRYGGGQTGKADGQENCEKETEFHPLRLSNLTKDFTTKLEALRVKKLSRLFLICCFASFKGTSRENTDAI